MQEKLFCEDVLLLIWVKHTYSNLIYTKWHVGKKNKNKKKTKKTNKQKLRYKNPRENNQSLVSTSFWNGLYTFTYFNSLWLQFWHSSDLFLVQCALCNLSCKYRFFSLSIDLMIFIGIFINAPGCSYSKSPNWDQPFASECLKLSYNN